MCYRIFVCTWKGPASIIHIFQSGRWHGLLGSQWSIFFGAHAHTYHLQHFLVRTHVPFVTYMCTHTRTICNTFLTRAATLFNSIKQKTVYFCSTRVELFVTLFLMDETVIHCTFYSWVIHKALLPVIHKTFMPRKEWYASAIAAPMVESIPQGTCQTMLNIIILMIIYQSLITTLVKPKVACFGDSRTNLKTYDMSQKKL